MKEDLYPIYRYFAYKHLPEKLQSISEPVAKLAEMMLYNVPEGAEKAAGFRKLLEAKDCFVRASLK